MTLSRDSFDILSFDCYGTLVDWEAGIWGAVQDLGFKQGQFEPSREDVMLAFSQTEAELEQESNLGDFIAYRTILERVFERLANLWEWRVSASDCQQFAESVKDWPVFEDTVDSLQAFAKDFPLYVLSNIDADLFAFTQKKLSVEFAGVLTADVVRSYKPAPGHFEMLLEQTGVSAERILHIAQSRFHDITPAKALGLKTAWLDRQGEAQDGATADNFATYQSLRKL